MATGEQRTKWAGQVVSATGDSRVELTYEGKKPESQILSDTTPAKLKNVWNKGTASKNRLFYGDNLPILAALLRKSEDRVKLIYIDPPYATNSVFKSRTQQDAYSDLLSGAHYIEFLRQRLILLRELLADDGSIYIHLDENMAFHIKVIMDEVFGKRSYRNWITRKKSNPKNYTRKTYGNVSDYILFYTKSDKYIWNRAIDQWTDERAKKEYTYTERETGRRYKKVPIHAPGIRNGESGKPWKGMTPPPGKHWQYLPATLNEMDARGEIYWSPNGNPRRKIYLDSTEGVAVQDIWLDFKDAHNQNIRITGYPTEKNPDLLRRIIEASSRPGDLVLDCFSGSGTTLAVASELDRNWIGIDSSAEAIGTTLRRFAVGTERMGDFVSAVAKQKSQGTQPALFAVDDSSRNGHANTHTPETDFSIFAIDSQSSELEAVLTAWRTQIR